MAVRKNTESDKEHCDNCDDEACDNPAHDRMNKEESRMAETIDGVTKRAERAEAQLATVTAELETTHAALVKAQGDLATSQAELATVREENRIAKMSPEEQRDVMLASMPELVRKSYLDQETRLAVIEKANRDLQDTNERLAYIQKSVEYRGLGFVPDQHWKILKAIDGITDEETRTELLRLLKAATEQLKTSPWMTTVGSQAVPANGAADGSAESQILALAKAHQETHNCTLPEAITAIAKAHPALWEQDQREKRFRNRVETAPR